MVVPSLTARLLAAPILQPSIFGTVCEVGIRVPNSMYQQVVCCPEGKPVSPEIHSVTLMVSFCKFAKCGFGVHFCGFGAFFCGFGGEFCGFGGEFCGFRVHAAYLPLPATTVPARALIHDGQLVR